MKCAIPYLATAIGSFPFESADEALQVIFSAIPDAPVWPQLPLRSPLEGMEIQYSEGMPRAVVDEEKARLHFDTTGDYSEDFAGFYEIYMAAMDPDNGTGDCSAMAVSDRFSRGIYALEDRLKKGGDRLPYVKVQVTGPCSFALTAVDQDKRAIYYNEEFRDVIVKALAMKCRWQVKKFAPYCTQVICFIDEPILSAFGSSTYISVKREDIIAMIAETVEAVHADGALAGVHCCGNTDWSILIDAGVDIVNFDAFGYGETIALYPESVKSFLSRGGALAWGIVPTSPEIRTQTAESLAARFNELVAHLSEKCGAPKEMILAQSLLTPSCGTGSMDREDAKTVFARLKETSDLLRKGR